MEKKINQKINEVIFQKNVLSLLNENVEKYVINSNILIFVDFLTMKLYQSLLEEIKICGLNNAHIEVVSANDKIEKFENKINETFGFVVCIGENWLLKFGQSFAIKNNINYGFVNLFSLKTEIFAHKTQNFKYFPPCFCLIEQKILNSSERFLMLCNIFKYSYFVLESEFNYENENLKIFSNQYLQILNNIVNFYYKEVEDNQKNHKIEKKQTKLSDENCQNFAEKSCLNSKQEKKLNAKTFDEFLRKSEIEISLMLEKFNFSFSLSDNGNEFEQFSKNFVLALCYKNLFNFLNEKNLWLSRVRFLNENIVENYDNIDVKFHRFFLLNFKEKFKKSVQNFMILNQKLLSFLKENYFKNYYNHTKFLSQNFCKIDLSQTFLQKMSFFEIFNEILNAKCLKV